MFNKMFLSVMLVLVERPSLATLLVSGFIFNVSKAVRCYGGMESEVAERCILKLTVAYTIDS